MVGDMRRFWVELRLALRRLGRAPMFAVVCVVTLALGIGANTAVFSVINTVLLRSLPVPNPEQIVMLHWTEQPRGTNQTGHGDTSFNLPTYERLAGRKDVFQDVMAVVPLHFDKTTVRIGSEPERASADMVSGNFFSGLKVRMALGRGFTAEDERTHAAVAVVSHGWWNARLHGDASAIGSTVYVKGVAFTVVGVTAAGFEGGEPGRPTDLWIPLQESTTLTPWGEALDAGRTLYASPKWLCVVLLGRLQPGMNDKQAMARIEGDVQQGLTAGVGEADGPQPKVGVYMSPARGVERLKDEFEGPLRVLFGMVLLVLAIACGNVALLFVSRNAARQREFAMRRALGAGTKKLLGGLLVESGLIAGAGTALGILLAQTATAALTRWSGVELAIHADTRVLLFTLLLGCGTTLLFGLAPLRSVHRMALSAAMKAGASTSNTDVGKSVVRRAVLMLQVAFCVVLLAGAALLVRSLRNLEQAPTGLRARDQRERYGKRSEGGGGD